MADGNATWGRRSGRAGVFAVPAGTQNTGWCRQGRAGRRCNDNKIQGWQKFILGHVKYCGETAERYMDKGYSVCVKKLGTIGVTVEIMRPCTRLPHEISIFSDEELANRAAAAAEAPAEEVKE